MEFANGIPVESSSTVYLADEYGDYGLEEGWEGQEGNTQEHILVNGYQGILDG